MAEKKVYEYRWGSAGRYELAGQNLPWLQNACKERGLPTWQITRPNLIKQLIEWENSRSDDDDEEEASNG